MTEKLQIFNEIRAIFAKYVPPLTPVNDYEARYELVSKKAVVVAGRARAEIHFGAIIIQSSYVGYYMMTPYLSDLGRLLQPELRKCLKGKSCFHIKKLDQELLAQIEVFTAQSFQYYQEQGWV